MPVAYNKETGDVMTIGADGQWARAPMAQNDKGQKVYLDGASWKPVPVEDQTSWYERAGRGVKDVGQSIGQLSYRLPAWAQGAGWTDEQLQQKRGEFDQGVKQSEADYQSARGENANSFDTMRMLGNVAATAPVALAIPGGQTLLGGIASGAATGGLTGALQPVTENQENFWTEKGKQALTSTALGGVGGAAANTISRAISPNVSPEVRMMLDRGVTPTPGQIIGGGAQRAETFAAKTPILGDFIRTGQRGAVAEFNNANLDDALSAIGKSLPKGTPAGNEAVATARRIISDTYDDAYSRLGARATPEFVQEVGAIGSEVPETFAKEFSKRVSGQFGKWNAAEEIDGAALSKARKYFEELAARYGRDPGAEQQMLGDAYEKVAEAIKGMVTKAHPEDSGFLDNVNKAYAMFIRSRNAAAKAPDGVYSPPQFAATVNQMGGKTAASEGTALMQPQARAALKVLGRPAAESSVPYALGGAGLGASYLSGDPTYAALGLGATGMYTPMGRQAMAALLAKRPSYAAAMAQALRQSAPYIGAGVGGSGAAQK